MKKSNKSQVCLWKIIDKYAKPHPEKWGDLLILYRGKFLKKSVFFLIQLKGGNARYIIYQHDIHLEAYCPTHVGFIWQVPPAYIPRKPEGLFLLL
jgi:hypothetical protein